MASAFRHALATERLGGQIGGYKSPVPKQNGPDDWRRVWRVGGVLRRRLDARSLVLRARRHFHRRAVDPDLRADVGSHPRGAVRTLRVARLLHVIRGNAQPDGVEPVRAVVLRRDTLRLRFWWWHAWVLKLHGHAHRRATPSAAPVVRLVSGGAGLA